MQRRNDLHVRSDRVSVDGDVVGDRLRRSATRGERAWLLSTLPSARWRGGAETVSHVDAAARAGR
jgi:hypothetical protein